MSSRLKSAVPKPPYWSSTRSIPGSDSAWKAGLCRGRHVKVILPFFFFHPYPLSLPSPISTNFLVSERVVSGLVLWLLCSLGTHWDHGLWELTCLCGNNLHVSLANKTVFSREVLQETLGHVLKCLTLQCFVAFLFSFYGEQNLCFLLDFNAGSDFSPVL